jgi:hypothetical protein
MCERLTILVEQVPYTEGKMWSGTAMWGFAVSSTLPAYQRLHGVEQGLVMFRAWWRVRCVKGGKTDVTPKHRKSKGWIARCLALGFSPEKASKWEIAGATIALSSKANVAKLREKIAAEKDDEKKALLQAELVLREKRLDAWQVGSTANVERLREEIAAEKDVDKTALLQAELVLHEKRLEIRVIGGQKCQELRRELRLEKAMLEAKKGRAPAVVGETTEWTDDEEARLLELTKIVDTLLYGDGKGKTGVAGGSQRIVDRISGEIVAALETGDEAAAERLTEELKRQQAHLAARVAAGIASIESGRGTYRNPLPTTDKAKVLAWLWKNVSSPYFRGDELNTLLGIMNMDARQVRKLVQNTIAKKKITPLNHRVRLWSD